MPAARSPVKQKTGPGHGAVLAALAAAADPDLALTGLARLAGAVNDPQALYQALRDEPDFRDRLTAVLGVSAGLADHLARHPEDADTLRGDIGRPEPAELREQTLRAVGANPRLAEPVAAGRRRRPRRWASRRRAGTGGGAGRGVPAPAAAPGGPRPDRRRDRGRGGGGAGRPRGGGPRGGARGGQVRAPGRHRRPRRRAGWPWWPWASAAAAS